MILGWNRSESNFNDLWSRIPSDRENPADRRQIRARHGCLVPGSASPVKEVKYAVRTTSGADALCCPASLLDHTVGGPGRYRQYFGNNPRPERRHNFWREGYSYQRGHRCCGRYPEPPGWLVHLYSRAHWYLLSEYCISGFSDLTANTDQR